MSWRVGFAAFGSSHVLFVLREFLSGLTVVLWRILNASSNPMQWTLNPTPCDRLDSTRPPLCPPNALLLSSLLLYSLSLPLVAPPPRPPPPSPSPFLSQAKRRMHVRGGAGISLYLSQQMVREREEGGLQSERRYG